LPVPGIDNEGRVYAPQVSGSLYFTWEMALKVPPGTPVLVGVAKDYLKNLAAKRGWQLVETLDMDEMAILNSIPTPEGAIMMAMQELPITIHGSTAVVVGLGRTGVHPGPCPFGFRGPGNSYRSESGREGQGLRGGMGVLSL